MRLFIVVILLFTTASVYATTEDFTTWSETDSNSVLSISSSRATLSSAYSTYYTFYITKEGSYGADITVTMTVNITSLNSKSNLGFLSFSNISGDAYAQATGDDGINFSAYDWGSNLWKIADYTTDSEDISSLTLGTYYPTLVRDGATTTVYIYSDSDRTVLVDTIAIASSSDTKTNTYVACSYDYNEMQTSTFNGYIENLEISGEEPEPPSGYRQFIKQIMWSN